MSFLVDTNVLSEMTRQAPDPSVVDWLSEHQSQLYICTITIGEIRYGIERLPHRKRQKSLRVWLKQTCHLMEGRILGFNTSVGHVWGQLRASWEAQGLRVSTIDGQIAAIAVRHGLIVATRNEKDFERVEIRTVNPFSD